MSPARADDGVDHGRLGGSSTPRLDAVILTDAALTITDVAGGAEVLFGMSRHEALGRSWRMFCSIEITSSDAADVWPRLRDGEDVRADARLRRTDGTVVDVHFAATPRRDAGGTRAGWLIVVRDRTETAAPHREPAPRECTDTAPTNDAHAALRLFQERLVHVFDSAGVVYFDHDLVTGYVYRTAALATLLGCAPSDLPPTAEALERRIHPDDLHRRRDERTAVLSGKQRASHGHYRLRHADGHWVWVAVLSTVVAWDEDGIPLRVAGLIADITVQKLAEQTVLEREAEWRAIFDTPTLGIAVIDAEDRWAHANQALCAMLGYTAEELATLTWLELTHPEDRKLHVTPLRRLHGAEVDQFALDKRYLRKDGSVLWAMVSVSSVRDAGGQLLRRIVFVRDITRRKEAERRLHESEAMFRTVVQEASEAIHLFDLRTGRVALLNASLVEQTGYSERELREMSASEALERVHPDDRQHVAAHLQHLPAEREARDEPIEYRWRRKDGSYRWISHTRAVVRDDAGTPVALVGVSRDVTTRRQADEAIRAALVDNAALISTLQERLDSHTLAAVMPICMYCKKIRDDENQWETVEEHITRHTASVFSHGMCPECAARFLSEFERDR